MNAPIEFFFCGASYQDRAAQILGTIRQMEDEDNVVRGARESLIKFAQILALAQGYDEAWLLENNIAYKKFKTRDNEISALRAEYLLLMSGG